MVAVSSALVAAIPEIIPFIGELDELVALCLSLRSCTATRQIVSCITALFVRLAWRFELSTSGRLVWVRHLSHYSSRFAATHAQSPVDLFHREIAAYARDLKQVQMLAKALGCITASGTPALQTCLERSLRLSCCRIASSVHVWLLPRDEPLALSATGAFGVVLHDMSHLPSHVLACMRFVDVVPIVAAGLSTASVDASLIEWAEVDRRFRPLSGAPLKELCQCLRWPMDVAAPDGELLLAEQQPSPEEGAPSPAGTLEKTVILVAKSAPSRACAPLPTTAPESPSIASSATTQWHLTIVVDGCEVGPLDEAQEGSFDWTLIEDRLSLNFHMASSAGDWISEGQLSMRRIAREFSHQLPPGIPTRCIRSIDMRRCRTLTDVPEGFANELPGLKSCLFPTTLQNIGKDSFFNTPALGITTSLAALPALRGIEDYAFARCDLLPHVRLPSSLESLGYASFYACAALSSADLSACHLLTEIPGSAFVNCAMLREVKLPPSIVTIGADTFSHCSSLTSVNLHDCTRLRALGKAAFMFCVSLREVYLPPSISRIDGLCFKSCPSLDLMSLFSDEVIAILKMRQDTLELGEDWCDRPSWVASEIDKRRGCALM